MTATFNPSYAEQTNGTWDYNGVSQDPTLAVNGPDEATAQANWFSADPAYAADNSASASGPDLSSQTPGLNATAAGNPTGLPTAAQASADAPLPLSAFGPNASVTPSYAASSSYTPSATSTSYANAATADPNANYGYLQAEENANSAALQPQFANQDQTNQDQLAARGISSSGAAADLTNQLYQGQSATLASADAPAIAQQSGYTQADIAANQANAQQTNLTNAAARNATSQTNANANNAAAAYNATNAQSTGQFNAAEGTAASGVNAGYYNQQLTGDATTYNNNLATQEQQGYNTSNEAYTAYLNSFGPNSGVTSGYNGAVSGIGNAASGAYNSTIAGQSATLGSLGGAAGTAAAGGAFR
jgi:hypothetical protein